MRFLFAILLATASVAAAACDDDESGPGAGDAAGDTNGDGGGPDATPDASGDAAGDASGDVTADASEDANPDAGDDPAVDATDDSEGDAGEDTAPDTGEGDLADLGDEETGDAGDAGDTGDLDGGSGCAEITGTGAVTLTLDEGATLVPTDETLTGIVYTYGLARLDDAGELLAYSNSTLLASSDGGCSWTDEDDLDAGSVFMRIVPAGDGTAYIWQENGGGLYRWAQGEATSLRGPTDLLYGLNVDAADPEHLVVAGTHGTGGETQAALWESTDGGDTWGDPSNAAASGELLIAYRADIDPNDLEHAIFGVTGGAYVTTDGGETWDPVTGFGEEGDNVNVFNVQISPVDGDVVWAMALNIDESDAGDPSEGRHLFRSADGGATFTAVADENDAVGERVVQLVNGPLIQPHPTDVDVVYFEFGTHFDNYGTDIFRYEHGAAEPLSVTHNDYHGVNAIAFSEDAAVMYLGLSVVNPGGF